VASENIECGTGHSYFYIFLFLDMVLSSSMLNKLHDIQHFLLSLSECRRPWIHKVRNKK
jgi:hypothetical protein